MTHYIDPISIEQGLDERIKITFFVICIAFIYGLFDGQENTYPKLVGFLNYTIIALITTTSILWCAIEKRLKGEILSFWWIFLMFVLAPISPILLTVFFFKERGTKGGFLFMIKCCVYILFVIFVAVIGRVIATQIFIT